MTALELRAGAATSSSDKDDGGDLGDAGGSFENDAAASRSKGRFEIKLSKPPFISPSFSDNHFMIHAMKIALLGDRILIDTFSFVTSMVGPQTSTVFVMYQVSLPAVEMYLGICHRKASWQLCHLIRWTTSQDQQSICLGHM